jgi:hypothetical protein
MECIKCYDPPRAILCALRMCPNIVFTVLNGILTGVRRRSLTYSFFGIWSQNRLLLERRILL